MLIRPIIFLGPRSASRMEVALNLTPIEAKIREATNPDEAWGPHGSLMAEIAKATFNYEEYTECMNMLWRRIAKERDGTQWRKTYKGLLLLQYIVRSGSERVIESGRDHIHELRQLERFEYVDPKGKDQGINSTCAMAWFPAAFLVSTLLVCFWFTLLYFL